MTVPGFQVGAGPGAGKERGVEHHGTQRGIPQGQVPHIGGDHPRDPRLNVKAELRPGKNGDLKSRSYSLSNNIYLGKNLWRLIEAPRPESHVRLERPRVEPHDVLEDLLLGTGDGLNKRHLPSLVALDASWLPYLWPLHASFV